MENILFSDSCRKNCWGGVEKWVVMMSKALRHKGYSTYLICRPKGYIEKKARENEVPVYNAGFSNSLDITTTLTILKLIRQLKIDVIVCSTNLDIKLAGLAGKIAGIPVISRQGMALIPNSPKYKFLIRNFTDSIITNTYTIKKQYENYGWFPPGFIQVIYNGVPHPQECTGEEIIRNRHLTIPGEKLILSAGRLNQQKGFQYLIETARLAQENHDPWKFIILGNGREEAHLKHLISSYQLKNIELLGFKKEIHHYYKSADLFVLSSLAEGTPNVVLEAMSYKCPVIATNVNGVQEVIQNNLNGWYVPSRDSQALYKAIRYCFANPGHTQQVTENAFRTVREKFTIDNSTNQFIEYMTQIIAKYEKDHH